MNLKKIMYLVLPLFLIGSCSKKNPDENSKNPNAKSASAKTVAVESVVSNGQSGNLVPIQNWNSKLVVARNVVKLGDVQGITNTFSQQGRIYAHATLTAPPGSVGGRPFFEVKWYNGSKLVSTQSAEYSIGKSPYYLSSSTSGTLFGTGPSGVSLYADGKFLASSAFEVINNNRN
jgi:hypothetical protein